MSTTLFDNRKSVIHRLNPVTKLIALLAIIVIALGGYMLYQQSQQPSLEIKVDSNGIQVNGNG